MITFAVKVTGGDITIVDQNEIAEVKWVDIETANLLMPYHPGGVESLLKAAAPYVFQVEC
ncbi:hypothetical protein [Paenibacillus faecalis]|uniref:hypothetical protein n=1 Tax=Paenibacillus faecalis TaxID=2079532 RepID=UPI0018F8893C|nr:hypothetical protein [Paenibacillus faecalis]